MKLIDKLIIIFGTPKRLTIICLIIVLIVFVITYISPTTNPNNILYFLSSISQGLAAIFTLIFTVTIFGAQMIKKYTSIDQVFDKWTIFLMIIFGIGIVLPLLQLIVDHNYLPFGRIGNLSLAIDLFLASFCVLCIIPYSMRINRIMKYEGGISNLTESASEAIDSRHKVMVSNRVNELTELGISSVLDMRKANILKLMRLRSEKKQYQVRNKYQNSSSLMFYAANYYDPDPHSFCWLPHKICQESSILRFKPTNRDNYLSLRTLDSNDFEDIFSTQTPNSYAYRIIEKLEILGTSSVNNKLIDESFFIINGIKEMGSESWYEDIDVTIRAIQGLEEIGFKSVEKKLDGNRLFLGRSLDGSGITHIIDINNSEMDNYYEACSTLRINVPKNALLRAMVFSNILNYNKSTSKDTLYITHNNVEKFQNSFRFLNTKNSRGKIRTKHLMKDFSKIPNEFISHEWFLDNPDSYIITDGSLSKMVDRCGIERFSSIPQKVMIELKEIGLKTLIESRYTKDPPI